MDPFDNTVVLAGAGARSDLLARRAGVRRSLPLGGQKLDEAPSPGSR
jgi:hypothetical protein